MEVTMYELLILGSLASHDMSGYKLRIILQNMMIPRHKVSNSAIYPVLKKLNESGEIELYDLTNSARDEKMAHLTAKGQARLVELMAEPIPINSKLEAVYRCKFRALPAVNVVKQTEILSDYAALVKEDLSCYESVKQHLIDHLKRPHNDYLQWGIKNLELNIMICQTKLDWVENELTELQTH